MDFDMIDRVINMLNYIAPQDVMVTLVEEDDLTPERAHIIICAAQIMIRRAQ